MAHEQTSVPREGHLARTKEKAGSEKVRYKYIFAGRQHQPITKLSEVKGWRSVLGLFAKLKNRWVPIGDAEILRLSGSSVDVHTDAVGLDDDYRKQGHGIHLYFALIRAAKQIGARRIYSSRSLNRYSGNMWCNKLRKFFDVVGPKEQKTCKCGCRACRRKWGRYYIDLTKLSLRSIPR
jgi:GNAT superfamily N-acetyltransferase